MRAKLRDVCGGGALNLVPGGGLRIEFQACGLGATDVFDLGVGAARITGGGDNSVVGRLRSAGPGMALCPHLGVSFFRTSSIREKGLRRCMSV